MEQKLSFYTIAENVSSEGSETSPETEQLSETPVCPHAAQEEVLQECVCSSGQWEV